MRARPSPALSLKASPTVAFAPLAPICLGQGAPSIAKLASGGHPEMRVLPAEVERCADLARSYGVNEDGTPFGAGANFWSDAPEARRRPC